MAKIIRILKEITPPIIVSLTKKIRRPVKSTGMWSGNYSSWAEAQKSCTGYDSDIILEKCKNSLLQVKNGDAVYERDSVLFDEIQYSWGLLAGLQKAAMENDGRLCVMDFGGSLGSSYYQNNEFLGALKELAWCIVEQPHFVECGKKYFEDDKLKFFYSVEECLFLNKPNVLLLSSVLQYMEKPYEWIEKFIKMGIPYIIIDRTAFIEDKKDMLTIQDVPESIYKASYPAWFFSKSLFYNKLNERYKCIGEFSSHEGFVININEIKTNYTGVIWKIN